MKIPKWGMAIAVLFVALAMLLMVVPVGATGVYPCNFYGTAMVNGVPVVAGTGISAWFEGSQVASTTTFGAGGNQYSLVVNLDESHEGEAVSFKIGALLANEPSTWQKLQFVEVPLTATTGDTTPPAVISTSPVNGATGAAVDTLVTATFNEAVNPATIVFTLDSVAGSVSYAGTTANFNPNADLAYSTTYTASIQASDLAGNPMAAPYTWSFTTGPDETPPTVISTSPVNGATGVPVGASVTATFSEVIQEGVGGITINGATGVSATIVGNTLTIAHDVFAYETPYEVTIPAGAVKDLADHPLAAPYTWSFTTGSPGGVTPPVKPRDRTPPTVISTSPVNGATGVAVDTLVTATFSEFVIRGTIVFSLDSVSGSLSYVDVGTTATFDSTADLDYSTTYTASIRASDNAGNPMTVPYTWKFTTEAEPPAEPPEEPARPELGPRLYVHNLRILSPSVYPGQPVTIYVDVTNTGDRGGSKTLTLMIDSEPEQSARVSVGPHSSKSVSFTVYPANPGQHNVSIENVSGSFVVGEVLVASGSSSEDLDTGDIIAIVIISIIMIFGIIVIFLYTRRSA